MDNKMQKLFNHCVQAAVDATSHIQNIDGANHAALLAIIDQYAPTLQLIDLSLSLNDARKHIALAHYRQVIKPLAMVA